MNIMVSIKIYIYYNMFFLSSFLQKHPSLTISSVIPKKSQLRTHTNSPIALSTIPAHANASASGSPIVTLSALTPPPPPPPQLLQQQLQPRQYVLTPALNSTSSALKITPLAAQPLHHQHQPLNNNHQSGRVQPIAINFTTSGDGVLTATSSSSNMSLGMQTQSLNNGAGSLQIISNGTVINGHQLHQPNHPPPQHLQPQQLTSPHLQHNVITTSTAHHLNGTSITTKLLHGTAAMKNGYRHHVVNGSDSALAAGNGSAGSSASHDQLEPPAKKVLKLINGTTMGGGSVTLSQVVVSPIQIELNSTAPAGHIVSNNGGGGVGLRMATNVGGASAGAGSVQVNGAQLQKLLVNSQQQSGTSEMARLPGGAELNILTSGSTGNGAGGGSGIVVSHHNSNGGPATTTTTASLYRQQNGKLAIVNNAFSFNTKSKW